MDGYLLPDVGDALDEERAAARDRSLANLRPFQPGESGNREGRKAAGATLREWVNAMLDEHGDGDGHYDQDELERIQRDRKAQPAKRAAAGLVLAAMQDPRLMAWDKDANQGQGGYVLVGWAEGPGKAFDRICQWTEGKPMQRVQVETPDKQSPAEALQTVVAIMLAKPQLLDRLVQMVERMKRAQLDSAGNNAQPSA